MRRSKIYSYYTARKNFNPRTHKECDILSNFVNQTFASFQSTHSQGVRRSTFSFVQRQQLISIHALTRSAAAFVGTLLGYGVISIHALTRSATVLSHARVLASTIFQSTHSQGVRPAAHHLISSCMTYFNPRTHKECDDSG